MPLNPFATLPDRVRVVQAELDRFAAPRYLEIGVHVGVVMLNVRAPVRVGVDPVDRIGWRRRLVHPVASRGVRLVTSTSDEFFSALDAAETFDVVLVDGYHTSWQALRDVEGALGHLAAEGVVLLHDANPTSAAAAEPDPAEAAALGEANWCGDVWRAIVHLRAGRPDLEVSVLDTDFGIGVIRRGTSEPLALTPEEVEALAYEDLDARREELLGLVAVS